MKEYIGPRPYLSWSALDLIERHEKGFIQYYFEGRKFENKAMRFGKMVHDVLEGRTEAGKNPAIDHILTFTTEYPERDYEYRVQVKIGGHKIILLAKLDGIDPTEDTIGEFKTGKTPWTERKVISAGQRKFYTYSYYKKFKRIPKYRHEWIQSIYSAGKHHFTGQIKKFEIETSKQEMKDLEKEMEDRILTAVKRIDKITRRRIKMIT